MNKQPLADKIRPADFDEVVGQSHLVGKNGILRRMVEIGRINNMIFYGPPGTGKTTVANIIAKRSGMQLFKLNATTASISDIKDVIANTETLFSSNGTLLYLDEIQYFNKKQQQSLLEFMEDGRITLIASTTENPLYYVYNAILSRAFVYEFKPVTPEDCSGALKRALSMLNDEYKTDKSATDDALGKIARLGGGDVRRSIQLLENCYYIADAKIDSDTIDSVTTSSGVNFDRAGDVHYDLLSALQKSVRGSDPDAALFYLAKILAGGDLISACRRLQVMASEDIGAAYPAAVSITRAACESAKELGLPEGAIPLANACVILATAPKSNSTHDAYYAALQDVQNGKGTSFPEHLRSPDFKGYKYPHSYPNHYVEQQYLPDDIKENKYYHFGNNKTEQAAKAYYDMIRKK